MSDFKSNTLKITTQHIIECDRLTAHPTYRQLNSQLRQMRHEAVTRFFQEVHSQATDDNNDQILKQNPITPPSCTYTPLRWNTFYSGVHVDPI
jgi:hypothetical protein